MLGILDDNCTVLCRGGNRNGGGAGGGGRRTNMRSRVRFSDFQISNFRFLFVLELFLKKCVGEISKNK